MFWSREVLSISASTKMPPRLNIWNACRPLAMLSRPASTGLPAQRLAALSRLSPAPSRSFSDQTTLPPRIPEQDQPSSPATSSNLTPSPSPGLSGLPGDELASSAEEDSFPPPETDENAEALRQLQLASYGLDPFDPDVVSHKFGLPELPLAEDNHPKFRYSPVVVQVTRLLMRDGKLGKAQRLSPCSFPR